MSKSFRDSVHTEFQDGGLTFIPCLNAKNSDKDFYLRLSGSRYAPTMAGPFDR